MEEVVVATSTFYPDPTDVRAGLAIRTAAEAKKFGFPLIVVDGGSPKRFFEDLQWAGAVAYQQDCPSQGGGRRQAMEIASKLLCGAQEIVVWTEPEKWTFIAEISKIYAAMVAAGADLAIPQRLSLDSYPQEQALAEQFGNLAVSYLVGRHYDHWFGPFAATRCALQHFLDYQGDYGDKWDAIHIPRLRVFAAGLRVISVPVSYTHPLEQTRQETGNADWCLKRIEQLQNMVPAFQAEAKKLGLAV